MIKLYTDGACSPNPGTGGWAFVAVEGDKKIHSCSGSVSFTTNNRMELTAVWEGVKWAADNGYYDVLIVSDSKYVVNGLNVWVWKWIVNGENWRKNALLWDLLLKDLKRVNWDAKWVRGHSGDKWNEEADSLCVEKIS